MFGLEYLKIIGEVVVVTEFKGYVVVEVCVEVEFCIFCKVILVFAVWMVVSDFWVWLVEIDLIIEKVEGFENNY